MGFFDNLFGSAPQAPDPFATAAAQAGLNSFNQYSPYGSTTYKKNAQGFPVSSTQAFSPAMQRQFNIQNRGNVIGGRTRNQLLRTVRGVAKTPWQMPDTARADKVADTMYARKWGMVAPEFERQQQATNTMLAERGLPIGSEAYQSEQDRLGRQKSSAMEGLSQDAYLAGGAEEDRLLRNSLTERAQPFNELAGFTGGAQVQAPPGGSYSPPNLAGMIQQGYSDELGTWQKGQSDMWNGLLGIGRAATGKFFG